MRKPRTTARAQPTIKHHMVTQDLDPCSVPSLDLPCAHITATRVAWFVLRGLLGWLAGVRDRSLSVTLTIYGVTRGLWAMLLAS